MYHRKDDETDWTIDAAEAKVEKGKPVLFSRKGADAKVGHPRSTTPTSRPPSMSWRGITFDHAVQTVVLSLPALRRLRFKTGYDGTPLANAPAAEDAPRTALAALALAGIVHQRAQGYDLRSRCLLVPEVPAGLEVVLPDGTSRVVELDTAGANALLAEPTAQAAKRGLAWQRKPV